MKLLDENGDSTHEDSSESAVTNNGLEAGAGVLGGRSSSSDTTGRWGCRGSSSSSGSTVKVSAKATAKGERVS